MGGHRLSPTKTRNPIFSGNVQYDSNNAICTSPHIIDALNSLMFQKRKRSHWPLIVFEYICMKPPISMMRNIQIINHEKKYSNISLFVKI